jgi:hypothetical protein
MTREMARHQMAVLEVFVPVLKENSVTQWTDSLIHWFPGVYHIPVTDTITGQDSMADWSGTVSSVQQ